MPNHPSWTYPETKKIIQNINDPGLQTYARIGYGLGGRIMENLPLKPSMIEVKTNHLVCSINTLKTRRGKYVYRKLPISRIDEPYYANALLDFAQTGTNEITLQDYLGIGGKRSIELKFQDHLGIVPHSLRHVRATHMGHDKIPGNLHSSRPAYLKYFFGWVSMDMATRYIDDLTIDQIMEGREE